MSTSKSTTIRSVLREACTLRVREPSPVVTRGGTVRLVKAGDTPITVDAGELIRAIADAVPEISVLLVDDPRRFPTLERADQWCDSEQETWIRMSDRMEFTVRDADDALEIALGYFALAQTLRSNTAAEKVKHQAEMASRLTNATGMPFEDALNVVQSFEDNGVRLTNITA